MGEIATGGHQGLPTASTGVLDAVLDACAWRSVLAALKPAAADIYFDPDYLRLQSGPNVRARLFLYRAGRDIWAYPFLQRQIPVGWLADGRAGLSDIESANGYGGPLASRSEPDFLAEARRHFDQWCAGEGVVAEFVRCHPLLDNRRLLGPGVETALNRTTWSIALRDLPARREAGVWPAAQKARNMVRRARRGGADIVALDPVEHMPAFRDLYERHMSALDAEASFFFDSAYFERLGVLVRRQGWLLAVVLPGGEWAAAGLFLRGCDLMHYHLSAPGAARLPGATNLLLAEAAELGSGSGLSRLFLGGGRSPAPRDRLAAFKASMATDSHEFHIAMRVHRQTAHAALKARWLEEYPNRSYASSRVLCYRER